MKSDRRLPVAIVGGGFSGTMVAAQLARKGIDAVLIEGGGRAGRASLIRRASRRTCSTSAPKSMSAWADDPEHFARWFEAEGGDAQRFRRSGGCSAATSSAVLDEAKASGQGSAGRATRQSRRRPMATAGPSRWKTAKRSRRAALVLATGNQPPEPLPFGRGSARFIGNPWGAEAQAAVARCCRDATRTS